MNFNINNRDVAAMSFYLKNNQQADLLMLLREIITSKKHGIDYVSKMSGISREGLYKILDAKGNPKLETLINLLDVIGLQLFCPQLNTVIVYDQPERLSEKTSKEDAIV